MPASVPCQAKESAIRRPMRSIAPVQKEGPRVNQEIRVRDVQLIDPPRASPRPVTPTRPLLSTLALLFTLAVGIFSAYAASRFRPVFFDSRSLRMATGLPLLGSIGLVESQSDKLRRRVGWTAFIAASGGLVAAFAAISVMPVA